MKPKQFYFGMLAALGILVVGSGAGYYWANNQTIHNTETLKQHLAELQTDDSTIDQLSSLKRQYEKIAPTLNNLDGALPKTKKQSEIIVQLQTLATNAGMSIPSASFNATAGSPSPISQTTKDGDALVMPLIFQMSGSYEQLQSFLKGVEKLNRYTTISNLAITKSDKPKLLSLSISLNVYLKP